MPTSDLQTLFNNENTYVIADLQNVNDGLPNARHILIYRDETVLASDLASGKLASFDGALYDDEAYVEPGNTTPIAQRQNPLPYVQNAASVLHAAGKLFLYTIGPSIGPAGEFWTETLPSVAKYPDVIDFQTQSAEGTSSFAQQVAQYSTVYRANGGHLMLVGIAVSPQGQYKSQNDITSAYDAAMEYQPPADGFWINIAIKSGACTGCQANPNVAPMIDFLLSILN
jgi:hypothetical protein